MTMADPKAQLQSLVDGLGNGGTAYLSRIACMNGEMARRRDNNAPGFFDSGSNITVGQACRALIEFSADASARGNNTPAELLAPFRELVDFSSTNPNPQRNQAAQALVNGLVNAGRDERYGNLRQISIRMEDGKTYPLTSGTALDAEFTYTVSGVREGRFPIPNRLYPNATNADITAAVEACTRGRSTIGQCGAAGQELAVLYLNGQRVQPQRTR
jgi:hypothetical protein